MHLHIRALGRALPVALATLASLIPCVSHAGQNAASGSPRSTPQAASEDDRFIVKLLDRSADPRRLLRGLGSNFGERLDHLRAMSGGAHVVRLGRRVMRNEALEVARLLRTSPQIESIEPDVLMHPLLVPNDTMYGQQWHYYEPQGGINLPMAWDATTGTTSVTVAVIDTGVLLHADLGGRLVGGFDFIRRVAGGTDPGDYGCNGSTSTWHGTHVAGTIGAASNNGNGVAGSNWVSRILPVRVLGKCGGYTSDIVDGMRWAAGIDVPGVPFNPSPARVQNLSLGADGACSSAFQSAINDVGARGVVVVVAAGNANADAANAQPANCTGVVAVAATTRSGGRASYSNHGSRVTISAPGGGAGDGVLSTLNVGTTTAGGDSYAWFQGTSMAAPHVSGVVSLMLSIDATLTPAQVIQRLQQAARAFPQGTGSDCNVSLCGAGIVDAAATLTRLTPPAPTSPVTGWTKIADEGQDFTVNGTQTVRYGSAPYWITKDVANGGSCTNAYFATDPAYGFFKRCEVVSSSTPPAGTWTQIASEGQTFLVSGTQTVRYGGGSSWIVRSVTNSGTCSNSYFGSDPLHGVRKRCEVSSGATPPATTWTPLATEWQSFSVNGTQTVRYGSGSSWITRSVTSNGACTNQFFGSDPLVGTAKRCELANTPSATAGVR